MWLPLAPHRKKDLLQTKIYHYKSSEDGELIGLSEVPCSNLVSALEEGHCNVSSYEAGTKSSTS